MNIGIAPIVIQLKTEGNQESSVGSTLGGNFRE